jgi:hypothetical protein
MATHTRGHNSMPNYDQIKGAFDEMEQCGIPREEVRGFRAPFLNYDQQTLNDVYDLGVLYDSSIVLNDAAGLDQKFNYGRENYWPFTLDDAPDIDFECTCDYKPLPGLWEIPMNRWFDENDGRLVPLDYNNVGGNIQQNFERHYDSNRAPFGIYLHPPWLNQANNGAVLKAWIEQTLNTYDDVFFVTNYEVLEWMRNPVPLSQYTQRTCELEVTDCFPPAPSYQCLNGERWNKDECACECDTGYCFSEGQYKCVNSYSSSCSYPTQLNLDTCSCDCMEGFCKNEEGQCVNSCPWTTTLNFETCTCGCSEGFCLDTTTDTCVNSDSCSYPMERNLDTCSCDCKEGFCMDNASGQCLGEWSCNWTEKLDKETCTCVAK